MKFQRAYFYISPLLIFLLVFVFQNCSKNQVDALNNQAYWIQKLASDNAVLEVQVKFDGGIDQQKNSNKNNSKISPKKFKMAAKNMSTPDNIPQIFSAKPSQIRVMQFSDQESLKKSIIATKISRARDFVLKIRDAKGNILAQQRMINEAETRHEYFGTDGSIQDYSFELNSQFNLSFYLEKIPQDSYEITFYRPLLNGSYLKFASMPIEALHKSFSSSELPRVYQVDEINQINFPGTEIEIYQYNHTATIDLVVMGDGFTSIQQSEFRYYADKMIREFFSEEPVKGLQNTFNVYFVKVVSPDDSCIKQFVDDTHCTSPLGAYYQELDSRFLLIEDPKFIKNVSRRYVPQLNELAFFTAVIARDTRWGGSTTGGVFTTSIATKSEIIYAHEMGHSLGNLADEYNYYYGDSRDDQRKCETNLIEKYTTTDHGRNISGNPNARWWNHLIGKNDDTYEGRPVSIYEGGGTCKKNRWRGCYLSKMQNSLKPWCLLNSELLKEMISYYGKLDIYQKDFGFPSLTQGEMGSEIVINPTLAPLEGQYCFIASENKTQFPYGLYLDFQTCIIKGTPISDIPKTDFLVTVWFPKTDSFYKVNKTVGIEILKKTYLELSYQSSKVTLNQGSSANINPLNLKYSPNVTCTADQLPVGLTINPNTCVISGIPKEKSSAQVYTIKSVAGKIAKTADLTIEVNGPVPVIKFPKDTYVYSVNYDINITPSILTPGGISCEISPAPQSGLIFSSSNCSLTGKLNEPTDNVTYTVKAANSDGSSSYSFDLIVTTSIPHLSYETNKYPFELEKNILISPKIFTGGSLTCTIEPELPEGIKISAKNCEISGKSNQLMQSKKYTVSATNNQGKASAELWIGILDYPPQLSFENNDFKTEYGAEINIQPTTTRGKSILCSISPNLPSGLELSSQTCSIKGKVLDLLARTKFTITARTSGGQTTADINLTVNDILPKITFSVSEQKAEMGRQFSLIPMINAVKNIDCSISPALPKGMNINQTTCAISGQASVKTTRRVYIVTAKNNLGSSSASFFFQVVGPKPLLSYNSSSYVLKKGKAIAEIKPTVLDPNTLTCTVTPALPVGLKFSKCVISGTPKNLSKKPLTHQIKTQNSYGKTSFNLNLEIVN